MSNLIYHTVIILQAVLLVILFFRPRKEKIVVQTEIKPITKAPLEDNKIKEIKNSLNERLKQSQQLDSSKTENSGIKDILDEERIYIVLEGGNSAVWDIDFISDICYFSPRYYTMLGFEPNEFPAKFDEWFNLVYDDDKEIVSEIIKQHRENRIKQFEVEFRMVTKFKTLRWILGKGKIIKRDKNGEPIRMVGTNTDITDWKNSIIALNESKERYFELLETLPMGLVVLIDKKCQFANPKAAQILKSEKIDFLMGREIFSEVYLSEIENGPLEIKIPTIDNKSMIDLELSISKIKFQQENGLQILFQDITSKKILENNLLQSQKMEAIGKLAGGVAHDFNNILTTILGYSELILSKETLADDLKDNITEIEQSAKRAASLTHQLLAYSRKQILKQELLDFNQIIVNMKKMLAPLIGEKIVLNIKLEDNIPSIKGDKHQIEQIIMNLVVNAKDAMPNGGKLDIITKTENSSIILEITDNGQGIKSEDIPYIFEPFYTTKETGKGTGLGLSVVYGIVNQHNGSISVSSVLDKGTVFIVKFPIVEKERVDNFQKISTPIKPIKELSSFQNNTTITILLVEDEESVLNLTSLILKKNGFNILKAKNFAEAKNLIDTDKEITILFSDIVLPDGSGKQVATYFINQRDNQNILFTSGYTDEPEENLSLNGTNYPFILKPYSIDNLLCKLSEIIKKIS
ncbi:PAS domain-containing protein [bacterium]|nr:PAS domain-containing protein [bacterium]